MIRILRMLHLMTYSVIFNNSIFKALFIFKNIKMSSFKSSENIQKKERVPTDLFRIINPLQ